MQYPPPDDGGRKTKEKLKKDFRKAFKKFDKNGDGVISPKEFRVALKRFKFVDLTLADVKLLVKHLQRDGTWHHDCGRSRLRFTIIS